MKLNILKIDLDLKSKKKAVVQVAQRIDYLEKYFNFPEDYFKKIELIKKNSYGCKITLKDNLLDSRNVIFFQLIFGSDWRKEINTFYNDVALKMDYSNRLFTIKPYGEDFKSAIIEDISQEVRETIKNKKWLH